MAVDTNAAQERRQLKFTSFEEVFADAEKLASSPNTKMLGHWQLGQLLAHLAWTVNGSIDGVPFKGPWYLRLVGFFIKGRVIKNGLPTGINLSKDAEASAFPSATSPQEALDSLRKAVECLTTERMTANHPVLGRLTHEEWTQYHLRHCELHLSFAVASS
jgi:hypothetical protein